MCQEDDEFYPTGGPGHSSPNEHAGAFGFHCATGPRAPGERGFDVSVGQAINDEIQSNLVAQGVPLPPVSDRLGTGELLPAHKSPESNHVVQLLSPNQRAAVVFQSDGNLVLTDIPNNRVLWSSQTNGRGGVSAKIQPDGNFVMSNTAGAPVWASGTNGPNRGDVFLRLQDDGNLVLYLGAQPLWSTQSQGFVNRQGGGAPPIAPPPPAAPRVTPQFQAPPKTTDEAQQRAALLLAQAAGFPPGSPQNIAYTQQAMAMIQSITPQLVAHPELAILNAPPAVYDRYLERARITGYYLTIAQQLAS